MEADIKLLIEKHLRIGRYVVVNLRNGSVRNGKLLEMNGDHIVLQSVEGFFRTAPSGELLPDIGLNTTVLQYDCIMDFSYSDR